MSISCAIKKMLLDFCPTNSHTKSTLPKSSAPPNLFKRVFQQFSYNFFAFLSWIARQNSSKKKTFCQAANKFCCFLLFSIFFVILNFLCCFSVQIFGSTSEKKSWNFCARRKKWKKRFGALRSKAPASGGDLKQLLEARLLVYLVCRTTSGGSN